MKDFFILNTAVEYIGPDYPQHTTMGKDYSFKAADSIHKIRPEKFPDFRPNFKKIKLKHSAILTDRISSAPIPFYVWIVSEKLLNVLEKFELPEYQATQVNIYQGKKRFSNYFALHLLTNDDDLDFVNYSISKFWLVDGFLVYERLEKLDIRSKHDLIEANSRANQLWKDRGTGPGIKVWAEYFYLKQSFLDQADLFRMPDPCFGINYYVSSNLRRTLEEEGVTGIRFTNRIEKANVSFFSETDYTTLYLPTENMG